MQLRQIRHKRAVLHPSDPTMPALSPAFDNPDDAARYVHAKIGSRRDKEYGGFILKRTDNKYVATEPIPGKVFLFDPNDVFPRNDEEGYVIYPKGHDDYALYHSHPSVFAGLSYWPDSEKATYPNSFSAADIYAAIHEKDLCRASYLSGPDGSLIKYTVTDSALETVLFKRVSGPGSNPSASDRSDIHQRLQAGTFLPGDVVRLLAHAGDLQVIVGSSLWGKPGKVRGDWKPYPKPRPTTPTFRLCDPTEVRKPLALSPVFSSADEAARYVHGKIGGQPHSPIIGYVLKNPETGTFLAAEPITQAGAVYAACSVFHPDAFRRPALPSGYRIDGMYVSPASATVEDDPLRSNFFQPADLHRAFEYRHIPAKRPKGLPVRYGFTMADLYFCAPDGALLGYRFSKSDAEYQLVRRVSVSYCGSQSIQKQLEAGAINTRDFIRQVAGAGQLRVLEVSANWPTVGQVRI